MLAAYLIAEDSDLWHVETREGFGGQGYARQLAEAAEVDFAYEVCSDTGAAFCESLISRLRAAFLIPSN